MGFCKLRLISLFKRAGLKFGFPILCLLLFSSLKANDEKNHILYLMQAGEFTLSFLKYQMSCEKEGGYDLDTLQKMSRILLEKGISSNDSEAQLLATYGAGLSTSSFSIPLLEKALFSQDLQTQLVALHFISSLEDENKERLLLECMNSTFLPTRVEAAYQMTLAKNKKACGQIISLMSKLPPFFKPLFPELFAILGNKDGIRYLKELINDPDSLVRVETIYASANLGREELIPQIRQKLKSGNLAEKECAAFACAKFNDTLHLDLLKSLAASSTNEHLKLSAAKAVVQLGDLNYKKIIESLAKSGNPFAINALGDIAGSEELLASFLRSSNKLIRLNSAISLLKHKDCRSIDPLREFFIQNSKDLALQPVFSPGKGSMFWRVVAATKDPTFDRAISLNIKEQLLKDTLELDESSFLRLAELLFEAKENELIPTLVHLLENLQTKKAIELLKINAQKIGAPLIRAWCNLSLYKLKEGECYETFVKKWISSQKDYPLIQLRPLVNWESRSTSHTYKLSAEETSRLLIEMYSAIAASKKDFPLLVEAMKNGNPKNNFALAGLLIRAAE